MKPSRQRSAPRHARVGGAGVLLAGLVLAACGGGGSDDGGTSPSGPTVTLSGKVTFDRVPFKASSSTGLDYSNPVESPARYVVVEAVGSSGNVLASTTTDGQGSYSLAVAANTTIVLRAKAQMLKTGTAPTWNFRVVDNVNADALYVLDSTSFDSSAANPPTTLHAATGWNGSGYTEDSRAAAPFAILDTVYDVEALVLTANATATFPALDLHWSGNNRDTGRFCPAMGEVGTAYLAAAADSDDDCQTSGTASAGVYIVGAYSSAGDTDEFDEHVIAHEVGHYFEDNFSRSESVGGSHALGDALDLRVAFSEGWGNAFSGMVTGSSLYRDSLGTSSENRFDLESGTHRRDAWYSEDAIHRLLWDLYDDAVDTSSGSLTTAVQDTVALGFLPLYDAMVGLQRTTSAFTSIFPLTSAIKTARPADAATIDQMMVGLKMVQENVTGGDFGENAANPAIDEDTVPAYAVPVYKTLQSGTATLCSTIDYGGLNQGNKLGNRAFLRYDAPLTRSVTVAAVRDSTTTRATDPDLIVWHEGEVAAQAYSETADAESTQLTAIGGETYLVELYDYNVLVNGGTPDTACFTLTVN